MLAHWGRYLCVLVAGFVENAVRFTYINYIRKTSSPQTARYATQRIERIRNPKADTLIDIAISFDEIWGKDLTTFLDDNFRKEAVNSMTCSPEMPPFRG